MKGINKEQSRLPVVVCAPMTRPLHFADNLVEYCHFCQQPVQLRPHNPRPHLATCLDCFNERMQPDDTVLISEQTISEVLLDRASTKGQH